MNTSGRSVEMLRQFIADAIQDLEDTDGLIVEEIKLHKVATRAFGDPSEKWQTEVSITVRERDGDASYSYQPDPIDHTTEVLDAFADMIVERIRSRK